MLTYLSSPEHPYQEDSQLVSEVSRGRLACH